jgi:cytochrome c peroxidase
MNLFRVGVALVAAGALSVWAAQGPLRPDMRDTWSAQEISTIGSMRLKAAGERAPDPSNVFEARAEAADLGKALFNDMRLSRNGQVSCASCHVSDRQFQDGRRVGQGVGTGRRRTMPVMGAAHSPFLFWDGRKDSLWSQALGPFEDAAEHGANRTQLVKILQANYEDQYQKLFGPLPELHLLPEHASPEGTAEERAAWQAMPEARRDAINRAFANMGKAIAAYERGVSYRESRFDQYAQAIVSGDARGQEVLSPHEVQGLRLFLTKGQCATCHSGPLLTDHAFHNTGVPPHKSGEPDDGRLQGARKLLEDEFNCLGRYSDAKPEQCAELQYLSTDDPSQVAAFRTPSLRNVADRAPYMHAGQFGSLKEVLEHYARSPKAVIGHSELAHPGEKHQDRQVIRLSEADARDIEAFLQTLSGTVVQPE